MPEHVVRRGLASVERLQASLVVAAADGVQEVVEEYVHVVAARCARLVVGARQDCDVLGDGGQVRAVGQQMDLGGTQVIK